jgi:anti-sigma regulatory factor (Ser/Thr protein kinase)
MDPLQSDAWGRGVPDETAALQTRCFTQAREIVELGEVIAAYRQAHTDVELENDVLRMQLSELSAEWALWTRAGIEFTFALDAGALAAARAAIVETLHDLPPSIVERALLVATELMPNSIRHSGMDADQALLLRIERAPTMIRIEVTDPGKEGVITVRAPDLLAESGRGLQLVQTLSERWGAERGDAAGTRVWAQLTLGRAPLAALD